MFRSNPDGSDWGYKLTASPVYPDVVGKPGKDKPVPSQGPPEQELVLDGLHPMTMIVPCKRDSFMVDYSDLSVT